MKNLIAMVLFVSASFLNVSAQGADNKVCAGHPMADELFTGYILMYDTYLNTAVTSCQHWALVNHQSPALCHSQPCDPR